MSETMADLVTRYGFRVEVLRDRGAQLDDSGWEHHAYELRVHFDKIDGAPSLDTSWRQGYGIEEHVTDRPDSVLDCLISDATSADEDFDTWCGEYGYDTDSREAYATWEACRRIHDRLVKILGETEFDVACNAERL
jgi:hypothetical protein